MAYKVTNIPKDYKGLHREYWNYFNQDSGGVHPGTCCGQAAIYSVMRTKGKSYPSGFKNFVKTYPPNNFFGMLGTSWQEIVRVLKANGFKVAQQQGEGNLRNALKTGPAIVCLDVGAAGWNGWGLHWTAVFGYTSLTYYLTNWDGTGYTCSRDYFNKGWDTWLTSTASCTSKYYFAPHK